MRNELYTGQHRLGAFCKRFMLALDTSHPEFSDQLQASINKSGSVDKLQLILQSDNHVQDLRLQLVADETSRQLSLSLDTAKASYNNATDCLNLLDSILSDELVLVSFYMNRRFVESRLTSASQAAQLVENTRHSSRGCLDFLLPARLDKVSVHSWSGQGDMRSTST